VGQSIFGIIAESLNAFALANILISYRQSCAYEDICVMSKKSVKNVVVKSQRKMVLKQENSSTNVMLVGNNL